MKKLIYCLAIILVGLSSCAKFDDPKTENYGVGPEVVVSIASAMPTDSAFTIQITPAAGATYYAYAISTAPAAVDSATLIKGGYNSNPVLNVSDQPSLTINIKTAEPNTTYYVYASACNDKGIVGKVASASIKTSDHGAPIPTATQPSAANKAYLVQFNQNILRGEGKVTAVFYKEYDFENPVQSENVDVQISGKVTQLTAVDAPAGAYVLFSWEAGAFVDATGNYCDAFTSSVNPEGESVEDIFLGLWIHVPTANWAIADSNIAPASGVAIGEWTEFTGTITMPFDIYAVAENAKDGDIAVTYKNTSRTITYNLPASKYAVSGKAISFVLPTEPVKGDIISVSVKEGIAFDVYGNPNASYSSENVVWKYVGFIPTMDMILGNFDLLYISYYDETGAVESLGNVTIEADPEVTNGIIIKDFFLEGSELKGTVNFDECKIYIPDGQVLGTYKNSKGTTYGLVFYTADGTDAAAFTINSDGSMVADGLWGVYAFDETFTSGLGWFDIAAASTFSPVKASASAKKVLKKSAKTKTVKNTTRKLNKRVSK